MVLGQCSSTGACFACFVALRLGFDLCFVMGDWLASVLALGLVLPVISMGACLACVSAGGLVEPAATVAGGGCCTP